MFKESPEFNIFNSHGIIYFKKSQKKFTLLLYEFEMKNYLKYSFHENMLNSCEKGTISINVLCMLIKFVKTDIINPKPL